MIRRLMFAVALILGTLAPQQSFAYPRHAVTTAPATTADLQLFQTEAAARRHCPKDEIVWLNTNSGIYHEQGMRYYGNTKAGAYVCKAEADAAGDRDTRNGQ